MDRVFLRDFRVRGRHGVHEEERTNEQDFLIDIEAAFDSAPAAASDNLDDTVNYSDFAKIAERVVTSNSFFLVERLAHRIADEILADSRIASVRVTVRKPSVLRSGVPGVTIERTRI